MPAPRYRLSATYIEGGQELLCDRHYALGDYAGRTFASREAAEKAAEELREDVGDVIDASVKYYVNEEDAPTAPAGWYLLWPEGAGWDAVRIGDDGDVIGTISEAGAQNHINARDRLAGIVEAIRSESTESVDTAVAEAIVWAWDTDADPACVVVERIVTS